MKVTSKMLDNLRIKYGATGRNFKDATENFAKANNVLTQARDEHRKAIETLELMFSRFRDNEDIPEGTEDQYVE